MKIVITGGAGFIGRRLARRLLERGTLAGADGRQEAIDALVLFDVAPPEPPLENDRRLHFVGGDVADRTTIGKLVGGRGDGVPFGRRGQRRGRSGFR